MNQRLAEGWTLRSTHLTKEHDLGKWKADQPKSEPLVVVSAGDLRFTSPDQSVAVQPGVWIIAFVALERSDAHDVPSPDLAAEAADVVREHCDMLKTGN
ncbi:MAG: hypothetical protein FJX25_09420 [Alphaproteobacteria bacterium]|nr:hypothetical protein [Alphaproteobacteria bacterium]